MKNRCVLIIFLATFFAVRAVAWGPTGHRVVAEIAQRHLKPAARERVAHLLGGYSLAEVANWADDLRSNPGFDKYKRLHFATVPDGMKSYRDAKKDPCGDLVAAIDALSAFLRTGSRDDLFAVLAFQDRHSAQAFRIALSTQPGIKSVELVSIMPFEEVIADSVGKAKAAITGSKYAGPG